MTFCAEVKNNIAQNTELKPCCVLSRLYGMLLFSRQFSQGEIVISSEHECTVEHAAFLLKEIGIKDDAISLSSKARERSLRISDADTIDRILFDLGYSGDEPSLRIKPQNFMCGDCRGAFVSGCFLTGGNVTSPDKGYHLEFSTNKTNLMRDFCDLLSEEGFDPKLAARGYSKLLYFKNSSSIEDMLTYMGATDSSLELMNTKIYKELVNSVNRRINCESANIDKQVDCASKDRELIKLIAERIGLDSVPCELAEIARLRLENEEASLSELGGMLEPALTKSGVSHRLRRIRALARELVEDNSWT